MSLAAMLGQMRTAQSLKHAARVAVACLEFVADEVEAGRIDPKDVVRAIRVCVRYCKEYLPETTLAAWPEYMQEFKGVVWQELLHEAGLKGKKEPIQ